MSAVLHAEPQCNPLGGGATAVDWDRLAGGLVLSPGGAGQSITRHRPLRLNRLLHGQAADQLPGLLAAIFALCGHAHRHTARLAIAAARGFKATPGAQDMMALRAQTAREHVRRILMEWPLPAAADRAAAAKALSSCPLLCESDMAASLQHLPRWLERYVLAMPPQEWLRELGKGGERWLALWCEQTLTPAAAALGAAREHSQRLVVPAIPLRLHGNTAMQQKLASALASHDADADIESRIALLVNKGRDTGPWARERDGDRIRYDNAWMRMASRLDDLVRLSLPGAEGAAWLCSGSAVTGPAEGLAWTEMARGLLVHWVRLQDDRVAQCQVLAPTDWNFHPEGPLAAAVASLPGDYTGAEDARLMAAAFDPCVPVRLQLQEVLSHA